MKRSLRGLAAIAAFSVPLSAFALENILRPQMSVRSAGMGGVRYVTGRYDENFFGNPAQTSDNPTWRVDIFNLQAELNTSAISNIGSLAKSNVNFDDIADTAGKNNHIRTQIIAPAFYWPRAFSSRNSFALGLVADIQADAIARQNLDVEPNAVADIGPVASFSRKFTKHERVAVGVNGRYTYRAALKDTFTTRDLIRLGSVKWQQAGSEGNAANFDIGATHRVGWRPKGWDVKYGAAINNVMGGKYKPGQFDLIKGNQPPPPLQPRTANLGVSFSKDRALGFGHTTLAFDLQDIGNNSGGSFYRMLHLGGELNFKDWVMFRAGVNQGYLCAGAGFDLPIVKIDVATYGEELSLNAGRFEDRRYAVRFSISL